MNVPDELGTPRGALGTGVTLLDAVGVAALGDTVAFVGPSREALHVLALSTAVAFARTGGAVVLVTDDASATQRLESHGVGAHVTCLAATGSDPELPARATRLGESLRSEGRDALVLLEHADARIAPAGQGFEPEVTRLSDASYVRAGSGSLTCVWTLAVSSLDRVEERAQIILQRADGQAVLSGEGLRPHLAGTRLTRGSIRTPKGLRARRSLLRFALEDHAQLVRRHRAGEDLPSAVVDRLGWMEAQIVAMSEPAALAPLSPEQQVVLLAMLAERVPVEAWQGCWSGAFTAVQAADGSLVEALLNARDRPENLRETLSSAVRARLRSHESKGKRT